jgi:flavin reductase (DIM6/NTAB) family NADH-FMN oxidoreductase RutF
VSLEPPLVLFCVDLRAPSLDGFTRSQHFAINVLTSDREEIARRFARPAEDKFAGLHWPVGIFGAPLLPSAGRGALVILERCRDP